MADRENQNKKKDKQKTPVLTRRDVLMIGGATALTAATTQVVMTGPLSSQAIQGIGAKSHHEGSAEHEWHMVIDLTKCIGCQYCVRACQAVNNVADDQMRWNVVFPERSENGTDFFMSRPCQHCQEAPCVRVCPVGARVFGDILDEESPVSMYMREHPTFRLREDWGTEPKVHYVQPETKGA